MPSPTDSTAHTTAVDGLVVDHWLEQQLSKAAIWVRCAGLIRWSKPSQEDTLLSELCAAPCIYHQNTINFFLTSVTSPLNNY